MIKTTGIRLFGGLAVAAMCASLSGCLIVDADVRDNSFDVGGGYPRMLGAEIGVMDPTISITAPSNGCTEKVQFTPSIDHDDDDNSFAIGFRRNTQDRCKALVPEGKRLTWSYAELGIPAGAKVTILNRVGR